MSETVQRSFLPGDDWLYYKIYTGPKTTDYVLSQIIYPIVTNLIEQKIINKWFFIRYQDPKHHLRLRFHIRDKNKIGDVISLMSKELSPLIDNYLIWNIEIHIYKREIERYGIKTISLSEKLFYYNSVLIAEFLKFIEDEDEGEEKEEIRWLFSLKAMDLLLTAFEYSDEKKLNLLFMLKKGFQSEFGIEKEYKKQIDKKYRHYREKIDEFMFSNKKTNPNIKPVYDLLNVNFIQSKEIAGQIIRLKNNNNLEVPLDNLLSSYLHMLMNRFFKSKNRTYELLCYDFLYRFYNSLIARNKYKVDKISERL